MKTNILLAGGYHKALSIGESLLQKGYQVTVVNADKRDCEKLAEVDDFKIIWGDASKEFILKEAEAQKMDIVIAMAPRDEDNFVIGQICKKIYKIPKVVAIVSDPKKTSFFYQMGIDRVVCAINAITNIIEEQALMEKMTTMLPLTNGKINVLEIPILENAAFEDKELKDMNLPKDVIIGCIVRGERSIIPSGNTKLLTGDIVILIVNGEVKEEAMEIFTGVRRAS